MSDFNALPKPAILSGTLWFAFCALMFSNAGTPALYFAVVVYLGAAYLAIWLLRFCYFLLKRSRSRGLSEPHPPISKSWAIEPTMFALAIVIAGFGGFKQLRFSLSEAALLAYAQDVRVGKLDLAFEFNHPNRFVGLYAISSADLLEDGTVRVVTSRHGLFDRAGFAHSQTLQTPKGKDAYRRINAQWWYWFESW